MLIVTVKRGIGLVDDGLITFVAAFVSILNSLSLTFFVSVAVVEDNDDDDDEDDEQPSLDVSTVAAVVVVLASDDDVGDGKGNDVPLLLGIV
jgi:hypothetical protein